MSQAQFQGGSVITASAAKYLRRYRYNGADLSLMYKYMLSPLAELSLVFIPKWMAPNVVTTIGLSLTTASYLLMYSTAPGLVSTDTPAWVFPTAALGLFVYQTLDNVDGKQARRTGSSSPLGLIFDHGCDAINCCFGVVFVCCILNAGTSVLLVAAVMLNQLVPFFFTTWEHYYTDELILPIVNGPSEGVILGVVCACLRGVYGNDLFTMPRKALNGWPLGEALMACSLFGVVVTVAKQSFMVAKARLRVKKGMLLPLYDASGFLTLIAIGGWWAYLRPELFAAIPYTMVLLFGLLHVDMAVHLMVCHICNMICRPIRLILVPFLLVVGNSLLPGGPLLSEAAVAWGFTAMAVIYESLYLYLVVTETSEALDIFVFKLGKRSDAVEGGTGANGAASANGTPKKTS